ncbi:MAG: hypothetical protein R3B69_02305 [Candidatus Paceibacterota bacterium]
MKWSPYLNALAASSYIFLVVIFIHFLESKQHDTPDTLIDGVGAISLFVFSAAVMAFLFFYQPVLLLLENRQSKAVSYFLKTLLAFEPLLSLF